MVKNLFLLVYTFFNWSQQPQGVLLCLDRTLLSPDIYTNIRILPKFQDISLL